MGAAVGGSLLGAVGGLLGQQKEGETDTGNVFDMGGGTGAMKTSDLNSRINDAIARQRGISQNQSSESVQRNPILGQLFGPQGTMQRTGAEEQKLSEQGYQLSPEDRTAYGQASGDIARQFGQQDQSLAQALSARGLDSSGVANMQFAGSSGNKMEQLAGAQRKIADDRMKNNMARLGQTRQFLGQLGGQAQDAINSETGTQERQIQNQFQMPLDLLKARQGQSNEALAQRQATAHQSNLSAAFQGGMSGGMGGMSGGMGGGGLSGGGATQLMAGGSPGSGTFSSAMRSDYKFKKNIIRLSESVFKDVPTYLFEYKNINHGPGTYLGTMAQDLLSVNPNHPAVINTPEGFFVDYNLVARK